MSLGAPMQLLRRELDPVTSEDARVGSLGPALFFVIAIGFLVLSLCGFAGFVDKPGPRRAMRAAGCVLVLVPTIFFATVTYVSDSSQIVTERAVDETYKPRVYVGIVVVFCLVAAIVSLFAGGSSPLLMHRQGRNIYTSIVKGP